MSVTTIPRPASTEYPALFARYIDRVPEGDVIGTLATQLDDTLRLVEGLSPEQADFRYAPGKWSIKQMLGHLADTERIFVYRALCFARGDRTSLPGFDEDAYVTGANFGDRTIADLAAELRSIRAGTVAFFKALDRAALDRQGVANNNRYTVRAVAALIAGHELHHAAVLRERYLSHV